MGMVTKGLVTKGRTRVSEDDHEHGGETKLGARGDDVLLEVHDEHELAQQQWHLQTQS